MVILLCLQHLLHHHLMLHMQERLVNYNQQILLGYLVVDLLEEYFLLHLGHLYSIHFLHQNLQSLQFRYHQYRIHLL